MWAILVTFADGRSAFLRNGPTDDGPISLFRTRKHAKLVCTEIVTPGLDDEDSVAIVRRDYERK